MNDIDREWRPIARLIAVDKEAALAEFRRNPLAPPEAAPAPAPRRLRLVLLPVAASLLLAAGLAALWLARGGWQGASLAPAGSEILADSFLYAAAGRAEAAAGPEAQAAASPFFIFKRPRWNRARTWSALSATACSYAAMASSVLPRQALASPRCTAVSGFFLSIAVRSSLGPAA